MKKNRILFTLFLCACISSRGANISQDNNNANQIIIERDGPSLVLTPLSDNAVRVQIKGESAHQLEDIIYVDTPTNVHYEYTTTDTEATLKLPKLLVTYDFADDALTFIDESGNVILQETPHSRTLQPSEVQGEATTISGQSFYSPSDEALFGTGQFQDGYLNIRGLSRRLTQVNTQISLPFVISNKGYGLLWNNYGLTDFNPSDNSLALSPIVGKNEEITVDVTTTTGNAKELRHINAFEATIDLPESGDYAFLLDVGQKMARKHKITIDDSLHVDINNLWLPPTTSFIAKLDKGTHKVTFEGEQSDKPTLGWRQVGNHTKWLSPVSAGIDYTVFAGSPDDVIAAYRNATGNTPLPPSWIFGYVHCRERYNTQDELLDNALEFRKRNIPIDIIVQDWQYWGKYGWNAMCFDEEKYPNPSAMVDSLHEHHIKLMLSVWAKLDFQSELGKAAQEQGYYIPNTDWVDFFNPAAADFYWQNSSNRLLKAHGIDAWWQDATEPENDDLAGRRIANGTLPGEVYRNAFPLFVNRTVYNGLRNDNPNKRSPIMTRSGFPGIQRYGIFTWSGDVGNDLPTLRRQIIGGLGQMAAGLPWWTYDAGGFFRPGNQYEDENYHNTLIRWVECSTFLPMMRIHGYMSNTEPWRYGEKVDSIVRKYIGLRYALLPYTYSCAAKVAKEGYTLMRPLVMDFSGDQQALGQTPQFMYGPSILVSPVTEELGQTTRTYLPRGCEWIDFWTGERHAGGQYIEEAVEIERIPLYIKAGAIIPLSKDKQYAQDNLIAPMQIKIYTGANGEFALYEDDGNSYEYENGAFSVIPFAWDDANSTLTIGSRQGEYPSMLRDREFVVTTSTGHQANIKYSGESTQISF